MAVGLTPSPDALGADGVRPPTSTIHKFKGLGFQEVPMGLAFEGHSSGRIAGGGGTSNGQSLQEELQDSVACWGEPAT